MPSVLYGATLIGVEAVKVGVEVDLLRRLPQVIMVGLPAPAVRESADRVRSAIVSSGFEFPRQRVVVALAPADLRKEGTSFDLPIAVGILLEAGQVRSGRVGRYLFVGELSLTGELRPVRGTLAFAWLARAEGFAGIVVPAPCAPEAALVEGLEIRPANTLAEVMAFLDGEADLPYGQPNAPVAATFHADLKDIRGQLGAREALEVAAAGGHNLLLEGPPGCGKTMLAARLPSILPAMTLAEALECTRIHSVAGLHAPDAGPVTSRPFRAPHHSISAAGLIGGASLRPGEVTLAHNGVLFLDEFPEFPRSAREVLRSPLEDRQVVLARASGRVVLPAAFALIAAANPCPCGNLGHPTRPCICAESARDRYRARLSGPLVDRIDLRIELTPIQPAELLGHEDGEPSADVRRRVEAARARQRARYGATATCNAELRAEQVQSAADAEPAALSLLQAHLEASMASARVGRRLLKVARTIADLDGDPRVRPAHVARAVGLRCDVEERGAA
ncbi:MAG: YifB family Mg chelatase-like AAA ATPase [Myxococcota bacterium]